jgi:hypothetical protein
MRSAPRHSPFARVSKDRAEQSVSLAAQEATMGTMTTVQGANLGEVIRLTRGVKDLCGPVGLDALRHKRGR